MGDDDRAAWDRVREGLEMTATELGRLRGDLAALTARMLRVERAAMTLLAEMREAQPDDGRKGAAARGPRPSGA